MTLDEAIERERLSDELRAIQEQNIAQLPGETYEENLRRRAELKIRAHEILVKMNRGASFFGNLFISPPFPQARRGS